MNPATNWKGIVEKMLQESEPKTRKEVNEGTSLDGLIKTVPMIHLKPQKSNGHE
jgi:hypothetical protein